MSDRVQYAQDEAVKEFIASVGRALAGMSGDIDNVCDTFTEQHDRHTAQAVLQLIARIDVIRQQTVQTERSQMRKDSGFYG
ncbi:hypothetical protein N9980_00740 [bacterium]|nr:hypothetical protein [bacterium]